MRNKSLKESQIKKIIKIGKFLFPEYVHVQIRNYYSMSDWAFQPHLPDGQENDGFYAIEFLIMKDYTQGNGDYDGVGYSIYWLEFLLTNAILKLNEIQSEKQYTLLDFLKDSSFDYVYLIENIYKIIKKLKKQQNEIKD